MTTHTPPIKLGVLNMTICFDKSRTKSPITRQFEFNPLKSHHVPTFIPRYGSQRQRLPVARADSRMSPYQNYRNSKNESIRYFREQEETAKSNCQKIAGFSRINNTIQLSISEREAGEDEHVYTPTSFAHDNHLRMVFNKKHLRNTIDLQQERIKTHERLILNFKTNPEENLHAIFTVRAAKTSQRSRTKAFQHAKPYKEEKLYSKMAFTQRANAANAGSYQQQGEVKKIRPWSTHKNWDTKLGMFDSQILESSVSVQNQMK